MCDSLLTKLLSRGGGLLQDQKPGEEVEMVQDD